MVPSEASIDPVAPSTRRVPAYEALAAAIKSLGIDAVFGLMSDDTALFVTTLDSMGVRCYGAPMLHKPDGPLLIDCKINASVAAPFILEAVEHERRKT